MRKCPDCGFEFDDEKSFCPSCGKYMPKIKNPYPSAADDLTEAPAVPEQPAAPEAPEDIFEAEQPAGFSEEGAGAAPQPSQSLEHAKEPSTWSFVLTIFLLSVPVVSLIYAAVLAFGGTKYPSKKHLARAIFLFNFILLVLISATVLVMMLTMGREGFVLFFNNLIGINPLG